MNSFVLTALLLVAVAVTANAMAIDIDERDLQEATYEEYISDGYLTPEELAVLFDLDEEEVVEVFEEFDENDDGVLEESEFDELALFVEIQEQMGADE